MSTYRVSWVNEKGQRVGPYFRGPKAKRDAQTCFDRANATGARKRLRLERGSTVLDGDKGLRLVSRDGRPVRQTVRQGSLWEGEG